MADYNSLLERVTALEARVHKSEGMLGQPEETSKVSVFDEINDLKEAIAKLQKSIDDTPSFIESRLVSMAEDISCLTDAVDMKLDGINIEINVLKKATGGAGPSGEFASSSKVRVPDPKCFRGARSAKELENFLWDIETYFQVAKVRESEMVSMASMFLDGDAKLWWRSRVSDDVAANRGKIDTWAVMKKELKAQFLPCNSSWIARESLRNLKHTGTVREYVNAFSSLMLDIREMSEEDKLFNFMAGLQGWAQTELRRQGVKDLPMAFAAADGLVDFGKERGSDLRRETGKVGNNSTKVDNSSKRETHDEKSSKNDQSRRGCFICGSMEHRMRDCPKKAKLNAMLAESEVHEREPSVEVAQMNVLRVLENMDGGISKSKKVGKGGESKSKKWADIVEEEEALNQQVAESSSMRTSNSVGRGGL